MLTKEYFGPMPMCDALDKSLTGNFLWRRMAGGQGWGRSRRDSLAELGITEEEFEEYATKKPAVDSDLGVGSLAMGMDVDPATQQPKPRTSAPQATCYRPPTVTSLMVSDRLTLPHDPRTKAGTAQPIVLFVKRTRWDVSGLLQGHTHSIRKLCWRTGCCMTSCLKDKCCIRGDRMLVPFTLTCVCFLRRWQQFCGLGWLQGSKKGRQRL